VTPEHWKRVSELFEAAVEREPLARAAFLARATAGDPALAEEVLRLLASDEKAGTFMNASPGLASSSISDDHLATWHRALRKETPSIATDLRVLLEECHALGEQEFLKAQPTAPDSPAAMIGQKVGAYSLEAPIGQGGMGTVWVARRSDGRFEGRAAVKFLKLAFLGGASEERFKREGSVLARLAHPNIAHLIDAGVSIAGQPYLVLEYVEGKHIDDYCKQHALDIQARIRLFLDVLAAVAHAHANLIVHRDIKPSNVLVTADGKVKLLDFGIAKLLEDETTPAAATALTGAGERALTLAYASPEQVTGGPVTIGTDVYALGVLLYLLLAEKHPAESALQSQSELMKAIVDTQPRRPSDVVPSTDHRKRVLRGDLDTIVAKAMKKSSGERYASVTAFAEDLRRYLGHQTISARPDTLAYRAKKFVRRNRLAVALASAAIVATGAGLVGTVIQARRATSAAERARIEARTATAVKDFLLGIFNFSSKRQQDPLRAEAVTARELLDRGAARLLADQNSDPKVAFELLSTLGDLYWDLGLEEKSLELRRKQVEMARLAFPRNAPSLAEALVSYAYAAQNTTRSKDSRASLEEAERILDVNRDERSLIRVRAKITLAEYWREGGGDLGRARSYAAKAIEICRRHHPNDPLLIEVLSEAASIELLSHHTAASIELYKEAIELHRRLGRPEIELTRPLGELAAQETSLSQFADAERDFKEVIALSARLNGENHVESFTFERSYGGFLRTLGRLRESEALLREVAERAVRLLGPEESLHVPLARYSLARTLAELGKIEDAELLLREAIADTEKNRPNTIRQAIMLEPAALLQLLMGRYELADRMLAQYQSIMEHVGREDSAYVALLRARYQLAVGEPSQVLSTLATATFSEGYALPRSIVADVTRARALLELGRAEEAERVVSASLERLSATPEAEELKANKAELVVAHGLALTRLDRAKEAEAPLRDALAWREANMDENSPMLAESLIALAECYLSQGKRAQARSLVERAQRIHRSHPNLGEHLRSPLRRVEQQLSAR